jgi:hypothetical protein
MLRLKRKIRFILGFSALALLLLAAYELFDLANPLRILGDSSIQSADLGGIPANQWVRYYQPAYAKWRRQGHAGIAYDTQRATFYILGSDTHGQNWDNSVHEFDPGTKSWTTHYPSADSETYRVDDRGVGISGDDQTLPWAMHSYDNVLYDPINDALVVTAQPGHNPISKMLGVSPRIHPTWFYYLPLRIWLTPENMTQDFPSNFAGSSAYDIERQALISYGSGLFELGPDRIEWQKVPTTKRHAIHHSMEYDSVRKQLVVFGDYRNSNAVWVYKPGLLAGEAGSWEKKEPGGDHVPPDQHFPVAFDEHSGVFLLLPDNRPAGEERATSAGTFAYDPDRNQYRRLPDADMPALGMNYMMVYDSFRRVFFLVTGDWKRPAVVWVLRLDLASL